MSRQGIGRSKLTNMYPLPQSGLSHSALLLSFLLLISPAALAPAAHRLE